jgi:hypothetical protein
LIERRQRIAGALQEQHRDLHVKQVFGAVLRGAAGRNEAYAQHRSIVAASAITRLVTAPEREIVPVAE